MSRVAGARDINALYSPKARREHFPNADWRFLVRAAINLSAAFANVHAMGCVVGDVNQSSVLVRPDAQVVLIDCDSFQIEVGGQMFPCEVGVPMFTPPELLERGGVIRSARTVDHDAFGLAILIFHLLFLGRHPFAGRPKSGGDLPIEEAIKARAFAYAPGCAKLDPPPHTLPLSSLPNGLQALFRRTFETTGTRPPASEWHAELQALEASLKPCGRRLGHHFVGGRTCPWCEIESATGVSLFAPPLSARSKGVEDERALSDATPLYRAILGIRLETVPPVPLPSAIGATPKAKPHLRPLGLARRAMPAAAVIAGLSAFLASNPGAAFSSAVTSGGLVGGIVWLALYALVDPVAQRVKSAFEQDKLLWVNVEKQWFDAVSASGVEQHLDHLRSLYEDHRRLFVETRNQMMRHEENRQARRKAFEADMRMKAQKIINEHRLSGQNVPPDAALVVAYEAQKTAFLDRRLIAQADIPRIGAARAATLASFGVESAADVTREAVIAVPGFGAELASALVAWRDLVAKSFVFDLPAAQADLQAGRLHPPQAPKDAGPYKIDKRTIQTLRGIEAKLLRGPADITALAQEREQAVAKVRPLAIERATRLLQSKSDLAA
jgi:DNA-binding helix-hairpin-helix protein with protein kinase domain